MSFVVRFLYDFSAAAHVDLAKNFAQIAVAPECDYRFLGEGVGVLPVGV